MQKARWFTALAALLWSLSGTFSKILALPGPVMATYRVLFAGLCILPLLDWRQRRAVWRPASVGMIFCFAAMNATFITAMTVTTAANVIFLQYTAPIWMILGSWLWLREPLDHKSLVTMALGLVGIGIILAGSESGNRTGIFLALAAGVFYAGVALFLRYLRQCDSLWLTFANHFASGVLLLCFILARGEGAMLVQPTPVQFVGLAAFGIIQMAIPYLLFSRALQIISPQEAGIITLLEPAMNPLLTYLVVGETPALTTIVGGAIILSGVLGRYFPYRRRKAKEKSPTD